MDAVTVAGLAHRYGRTAALEGVDLTVPTGAVYALLGPNGAGKTTLLRILTGLLRPTAGRVTVLGRPRRDLRLEERAQIGWVAESQRLPGWMRLRDLEAYVAPLYPRWSGRVADELRARFRLPPERRIGRMSRGEQMKAALLCALAARPRLLLMDEPFTGMDVVVRDDLVRGLLASVVDEGTTVLISSHDLAELESLADHVGFLDQGRMLLSESAESLRARFRHVEVIAAPGAEPDLPADRLLEQRSERRVQYITSQAGEGLEAELRRRNPGAVHIEVRSATLREVFIALAGRGSAQAEVAA